MSVPASMRRPGPKDGGAAEAGAAISAASAAHTSKILEIITHISCSVEFRQPVFQGSSYVPLSPRSAMIAFPQTPRPHSLLFQAIEPDGNFAGNWRACLHRKRREFSAQREYGKPDSIACF